MGITAAASMLYFVVCLVLGIGWLLSLAAIAIDRCDGAEALSRGICYVLSRWQRVLVYAAVCCLMLLLSNLVMSWLAGNAQALASSVRDPDPCYGESLRICCQVTGILSGLFRLSLFFCEIAIVYVLLRNVEDGVSMQEINGGRSIIDYPTIRRTDGSTGNMRQQPVHASAEFAAGHAVC